MLLSTPVHTHYASIYQTDVTNGQPKSLRKMLCIGSYPIFSAFPKPIPYGQLLHFKNPTPHPPLIKWVKYLLASFILRMRGNIFTMPGIL